LVAHFAKRNTKFGGGGKRGRAKIPGGRPLSNPLPFCPPERSVSAARSAAISWSSVQKKVRASFSNRDQTRLLSFLGEEVCSAFAKATADRSLISLQVKYTKTGGRAKIH